MSSRPRVTALVLVLAAVAIALPLTGSASAATTPPRVLLTFDDGPSPRWTPQVLTVLKRHRVHAVFCMVGQEAQRYPALVRQVVADGHALCNHTTHHDMDLRHRSASQIRADLSTTQRILSAASGGAVPRWFRAPGGGWSTTIREQAAALGMRSLSWTVDTRDWARPGVTSIVSTVLRDTRAGGVVLLHDGGGDRSQTVAALSRFIPELQRRGYALR